MAQTAQTRSFESVENEAQRVFKLQREAYARHPFPTYEERIGHLRKLDRILVENRLAIADAIRTQRITTSCALRSSLSKPAR